MANLNVNGTIKSTGGGTTLFDVDLVADSGENYIKYDNGIMICWGIKTVERTNHTYINGYPITLPQPYKDNLYGTFFTAMDTVANNVDGYGLLAFNTDKSTSVFRLAIRNLTSSSHYAGIYWLTIGYWK